MKCIFLNLFCIKEIIFDKVKDELVNKEVKLKTKVESLRKKIKLKRFNDIPILRILIYH